ncbi:MAG: (Fe-S)-binding protein [Gudongella sp.]|nr:(Fe-S)-binding protein [Gudongella sp.]
MKISQKNMDRLNENKCIGCKKCMKGCPMLDKFCDSPKELLKDLSETGEFDYNLPYACMLCGYCTRVCPVGVDLKSLFLNLRRDVVEENNGKLPKDLNTRGVDIHQKLSYSNIFTSDILSLDSDTIFFPGCGLLSNNSRIVKNTYNYLKSKIPGIGIYTKCCGKPTKYMGKEDKFKQYYSIIDKEFKDKNIKRIITGCQNCYMTIGENSKDIEVLSLWEILADLGIPTDKRNIGKGTDYEFTIHDPCPTRDVSEIHDAIRSIVKELGFKTYEMEYNRGETLCCGAGGMVSITQPDIAESHMKRRRDEAPSEHIITYCQECTESMRSVGKASYHILDILFNDEYQNIEHKNKGLIEKWANRYRSKSIGK